MIKNCFIDYKSVNYDQKKKKKNTVSLTAILHCIAQVLFTLIISLALSKKSFTTKHLLIVSKSMFVMASQDTLLLLLIATKNFNLVYIYKIFIYIYI